MRDKAIIEGIKEQLVNNPNHPNRKELADRCRQLQIGVDRIDTLHLAINYNRFYNLDNLSVWDCMLIHKEIASILKSRSKINIGYRIPPSLNIKVLVLIAQATIESYRKQYPDI